MPVEQKVKMSRFMLVLALICLTVNMLTACRSGNDQMTSPGDGSNQKTDALLSNAVYQQEDREILENCLKELASHGEEPIGQLVTRAGMMFLRTPYVAHTLEGEQEALVVNLRELDCTTFAEYCLAIARTVQQRNPSYEVFLEELQLIRYRDGQLEAYPSRLHYFCDWIYNNDQKGLVKDCTASLGGEILSKEIHFMSSNPDSYTQLLGDSTLLPVIREQEKRINGRDLYYIPEEVVGESETGLETGDIVGITTDMDGIAVMHVGILVSVDARVHLMHASSAAGKVVISEEPLELYLLQSNRATGIMVARPI
jgi:hypothetical protein